MSHVFISYSKQNRTYARQLADHLLSLGFDVWIDDQIDYGDDWWRTIVRAIRGASAFIVIMTDESDASDWVQREVTLADKHHIPAFPVWLSGDFHASENWSIYVRTQYVDVRSGTLPKDDYFNRLAKSASPKATLGVNVTETPTAPPTVGTPFLASVAPKPTTTDQSGLIHQLTAATLTILPLPFDWCFVPGGSVTLLTNPPKTYDVEDFLITKYPVTNAQFQAFYEARGGYVYEDDYQWYDFSPEAINYRRQHFNPTPTAFQGDNLPRTNISWFDAVAFCRWLTARIQSVGTAFLPSATISLPTEQQWQRAAIGDIGWNYPWGDTFDMLRCCFNVKSPVTVTEYPNGNSPYGVSQMSGNVWEWCSSDRDIPSQSDIGLKDVNRELRGGSWNVSHPDNLRATNRAGDKPTNKSNDVGFRLVVALRS